MDSLEKSRKQLDRIDNKIIKLLYKRQLESQKIGKIKAQTNIPVYDQEREERLLKEIEEEANKYGLDKTFINNLFKIIVTNSKDIQKSDQ